MNQRFCSRSCWHLWHLENMCGEDSPHWKTKIKKKCKCGQEFEVCPSQASQKFCSYKCMGESQRGENSPNWQGGPKPYGPDFTDKLKGYIRRRDNHTCAISGEVWRSGQPTFHVHHIDYYKTNNARFNLITLEPSCHVKTNANRDLWQGRLAPIAQAREKAYGYAIK